VWGGACKLPARVGCGGGAALAGRIRGEGHTGVVLQQDKLQHVQVGTKMKTQMEYCEAVIRVRLVQRWVLKLVYNVRFTGCREMTYLGGHEGVEGEGERGSDGAPRAAACAQGGVGVGVGGKAGLRVGGELSEDGGRWGTMGWGQE
jgi:hypothetical protein